MATTDGVEEAWKQYHEQSGGMEDKQVRGIALLVLGKKMAGYPTTIDEDKQWLNDNKNERMSRKWVAVQVRLSEKTIVSEWMRQVKGDTKRKGKSNNTKSSSKKPKK